ncbi:MAG: PaaI family thioesterase [Nocardioidaceae bacterium]
MDDLAFDMGLLKMLGLQVQQAEPRKVVVAWTVGEQHLQPYRITHGGVHCAVHETAASIGAALWFGDRGQVVGVSNLTDFLRASRPGDRLVATAEPVHQGRLQQLWVIETRDEQGRLVARGQVRLQNLEGR